ncbi:MAG: alpha-glucan family phosphorylase, partial [Deltaproteobacteria bacterium]|nr:alpha-glucan family phosphorylase [Deltaproteobacteria bacterium]
MNPYSQYNPQDRKIAYFSMEIGLSSKLPIYSGGLGILAGDTIKSFADLGVPAVGISLLYTRGYFHQEIDAQGNQSEIPVEWDPSQFMTLLPEKITVTIEGRIVLVQAWVYEVEGITGYRIPVLFLDANTETNAPQDRELTAYLYGGDERYRLKQEIILGLGGVRILQILDHDNLEAYHMNEGHAALLSLELMDRYQQNLEKVRELCIFTTHTPVPAGHDTFDVQMTREVLGDFFQPDQLNHDNIIDTDGRLNMTYLALFHAEYINGVAKKHGETAQQMFPEYRIDAITNGIHTRTWVVETMASVFDSHIPNWRNDPYTLRNALNIPRDEIWDAHQASKYRLIDFIRQQHGISLDSEVLTIGFARRSAKYKRATLVLDDPGRLKRIAAKVGRIQIIFAGKAHPKDDVGKDLIRSIFQSSRDFREDVTVLYLPNYDMYRAKLLVAGVDLWLNTPLRPMEASGTSGMKAAVNGVINFSVLDGWWIEGHIEDLTGWSIGPKHRVVQDDPEKSRKIDVEDLYTKLENRILPLFYIEHERWKDMMAYNIALNGSFFNTHRMVS